jgi:hypothetical protein
MRDAYRLIAGIHPADIFINELWFVSRRGDAGGRRNEFWHEGA